MTHINRTAEEFTPVGLIIPSKFRFLVFFVIFVVYVITLCGNVFIILTYRYSPNLHTPMYFFLSNLSALEICYVTSITPKMLSLFFVDWNPKYSKISFYECVIQLYCFISLGTTEFYFLAAMAYDRYNAICQPLLYITIMNRRTCIKLIVASYLIGAVNALPHTIFTFSLPFCKSRVINTFFCDVPALLRLACANTKVNEAVIYYFSGAVASSSVFLILTSYAKIISTILKIHSATGRKKAFSTCTSHLMVVTLFYGSVFFMYSRPKSSYTDKDKVVSVVYTVVAPFLNPFIYSIRNNEVKTAFRKMVNIK